MHPESLMRLGVSNKGDKEVEEVQAGLRLHLAANEEQAVGASRNEVVPLTTPPSSASS